VSPLDAACVHQLLQGRHGHRRPDRPGHGGRPPQCQSTGGRGPPPSVACGVHVLRDRWRASGWGENFGSATTSCSRSPTTARAASGPHTSARRSAQRQRDPAHSGTPQRSSRRRVWRSGSRRECPARRHRDPRLSTNRAVDISRRWLGVMSSESEMPTMSAERAAARRARGSPGLRGAELMGWQAPVVIR
jgi:hypothetical protein